jgi:hypothetical protein
VRKVQRDAANPATVPDDLGAALERRARDEDRSMSAEIRRARSNSRAKRSSA